MPERLATTMRRNLSLLYTFAFLKMTLFPMAVITLFWKDHIGLSLSEIMLLQGGYAVATALSEYPSGLLADRFGYRASLTLASVLGIAGWSLYTVAGSFWSVLAAEVILGVSFAFISGSDSALLFETLRETGDEEHYHACDGRMTAISQSGEACGALFAGLLYAAWPLLPFFLQIGAWGFALLITRGMVEAPAIQQPAAAHESLSLTDLVKRPGMLSLLLYSSVLGLASFYPVWLIQPFMKESNVPISWFGPIWTAATLTVAFFSYYSARICNALGDKWIGGIFFLLIAIGYAGLGWSAALFSFLFYFPLAAMRGLKGPMLRSMIQHRTPPRSRASILSFKSITFRLLFVVTGPLIGIYADAFGLLSTFRVSGALLAFCSLCLLWTVLRQKEMAASVVSS